MTATSLLSIVCAVIDDGGGGPLRIRRSPRPVAQRIVILNPTDLGLTRGPVILGVLPIILTLVILVLVSDILFGLIVLFWVTILRDCGIVGWLIMGNWLAVLG